MNRETVFKKFVKKENKYLSMLLKQKNIYQRYEQRTSFINVVNRKNIYEYRKNIYQRYEQRKILINVMNRETVFVNVVKREKLFFNVIKREKILSTLLKEYTVADTRIINLRE